MRNRPWSNAARPSQLKRLGLGLALVFAALVASAVPAYAGDTKCIGMVMGTHDNVVVPPGMACDIGPATVRGNIVCREESVCFVGTTGPVTVKGTITCERGATCVVLDSTVYGNLKCDRCDLLDVFMSSVRGNVQSTNSTFGSSMHDLQVGGDVQFEGTGQFLDLRSSTIGGDVQIGKALVTMLPAILLEGMHVTNNVVGGDVQVVEATATAHEVLDNDVGGNVQFFKNRGPADISGNTISENLQCKENVPPPTGGGNVAEQKEDQCAAL